ncbi:lipocalin family protein [Vibrio panuliri]|uniref:Outer membrane lipoprotein Blc n=1 Tax=Vibrio panuliri TaxID=1381081 RepID=A0ABX3FFN4_9VIBR|nr:lipocalin family protein [Vibrio panuliri]KAB1457472.1 lipocalin [Vibrio panuliri]OLQ91366.1 lipocalin [Vibrio panuliri]
MKFVVVLLGMLSLSGCLGMPERVKPVDNFELSRYEGKWYEIARLDHSFEEGLERVTAEYLPLEKSGVAVINRGYDPVEKAWQQADGKAFFVNRDDIGHLQVSFFGPFYSSYVVFGLDKEDYQYAFVSGPTLDYLWLLARTPQVPQSVIDQFIEDAQSRGFDTDNLIFVKH